MSAVIVFALLLTFQQHNPSSTAHSSKSVICIDPGHPSEVSSGAELQNGTTEVHIVWMVSLKLQKLLKAEGFKIVMTKSEEDELVKNKDRARIANEAKAALLVRLHCDASPDSGFAIYYPDRQGSKDSITGPSEMVMQQSQQAAEAIHAEMARVLKDLLKDGGVRGDSKTLIGSKQGALTGSIFSQVPVVTIEMVVLSNKSDAEFIKAEEGQRKMAQAIAAGVARFLNNQK
ncbi:N-acetylmuramoyl-L-alanine amidase [candidate division KSB1 bacterium]|nr:N-acetylmuramoyl-L-alanine amidase [candidate division KSB1 bacterium]